MKRGDRVVIVLPKQPDAPGAFAGDRQGAALVIRDDGVKGVGPNGEFVVAYRDLLTESDYITARNFRIVR
jgi:hypothetical protein